jgi:hypothetical protein
MGGSRAAVADHDPDAAPADGLARLGQLLTPVLDTWLALARLAVMLEPGPAAAGAVELWEDGPEPPVDQET